MMSAEDAGNYLTAVLNTAVVMVIIPAVILAVLLGGVRRMLLEATANPQGFIASSLSDPSGKPSSDRVAKLVALCISSWMCSVVVFSQPSLILEALGLYMLAWGATDVTKHYFNTRQASPPAGAPPT
jgi:hypothetical protein